jgi:hypothetical protein
MNTKKTQNSPIEDTVVSVTNLVVSAGVGLVVREVVNTILKEKVMENPKTKFLLTVGTIAISGVISDTATKKYETQIRSIFKRIANLSKPIVDEKEIEDLKKRASEEKDKVKKDGEA